MATGLQHLHSFLAYLALLGLIISFLYGMIGAFSGREFTEKDRKFALFGLIPVHVQFLVGIILYFVSPLGLANLSAAAMSDAASRLYAVEHPLINIIAVAVITVGYSRAKKITESKNRFRSIYMFYGVGLILILSRIPWGAWFN
ncbi:hypothetical protein [Lunatimonas salinarum]|uniref:hypothetical protein n=1 Tax=Lunatimonas salinarum TaxID=1774590 RepID=UPI001AE09D0A|nr:hypothetical protein [Lunatimonas salinarum]